MYIAFSVPKGSGPYEAVVTTLKSAGRVKELQEKEFEEQRQNDEKLKRKRTEQKDRLEKVSFDMMRDIMQLRGTGGSSKAMRRDGSRMIGIMHALTSVQASGLRTRAIQEEHGAEENDRTRAGGAD